MKATLYIAVAAGFALYVVLWFGGIISSALWGEAPDEAKWAGPAFLYLASALILWRLRWTGRALMLTVGIYGFLLEIVGSQTGIPFGGYEYSSELGLGIFGVPIALVSAWIVISTFVVNLLLRMRVSHRWWILIGPALMVIVDLILEPVATGPMNAWEWKRSGIYYGVPATNFVGWFIVSLPIFTLLSVARMSERGGNLIASSVILFFVFIAIVHGLWGAPLVALGIVGGMVARKRWLNRGNGSVIPLKQRAENRGNRDLYPN